jgi:hypothetical protein
MALFRKEAIAHRYETGWATPELIVGPAWWEMALALAANLLSVGILVVLVR